MGRLSPSSSSQPVGKQGAVVVVWLVVDCFWDLTEMELAGSNVMILLYSGDILLVIRQTGAAREYVTFWQYTLVASNIFMPMRMMGHLKRTLMALHSIAERQSSPMGKKCGLRKSWHNGTALVPPWSIPHFTQMTPTVHHVCTCPNYWHFKHHNGFGTMSISLFLV